MKKIILSLAAVLVFSLTSDAQTRKGTVLLGAGSEMSNNEWTSLAITPKVGYFVQDGVAIGALINFQSDNVDKSTYELNNSVAEIGVFGRYYVSNNLFTEVSLSSQTVSSESYEPITKYAQVFENGVPQFDADGNAVMSFQDVEEVVENSDKSLNFNLGLGYTIVWREHFAVEPFMNLTFMNGERKVYNSEDLIVESHDLKGTNFNLGVNFSLFF
ncbi:MAG: hypothetical protein CND86_02700 [Bacteroidetes bacterium MED-G21]|nr:MAG: hypothetical protein CND86_02700 [Bacteroidetes bacterium MED-G21]